MARKSLSFDAPPGLAIAEGATTPDPGIVGVEVWSTILGRRVFWDGLSWQSISAGSITAGMLDQWRLSQNSYPDFGMADLSLYSGDAFTRAGAVVTQRGRYQINVAVGDGLQKEVRSAWFPVMPSVSAEVSLSFNVQSVDSTAESLIEFGTTDGTGVITFSSVTSLGTKNVTNQARTAVTVTPGATERFARFVFRRLAGGTAAAVFGGPSYVMGVYPDASISLAKMANIATSTLLGRASAGAGVPQALTATQATALLNTFTVSLKGLVPPPAASVGAFLRDDGAWAIPSGGGGSPAWGGITGALGDQADLAAALAGKETAGAAATVAAMIPIVDPLDLSASNPAAPSANTVRVFGRKVGGRMMVAIKGPSGLDTSLQPHSGRNKIATWFPAGNGTVIVANGAAALTATGTATAANVAATNRHTYQKRLDYLVTTAATTAVAGWRAAAAQWSIGSLSAGNGGFHFVCRFGPATGASTATNRCFVGMASSTAAPTDVEPSTITNIVGVGWDAADATIQIMHRGAGAITKIDTGIPVPTIDRFKSYELALFSPPGTTQQVSYEFTDLDDGGVVFSGAITTNMPTATTFLAPRGWMSVGGTSSVIGISLMSLYVESDY